MEKEWDRRWKKTFASIPNDSKMFWKCERTGGSWVLKSLLEVCFSNIMKVLRQNDFIGAWDLA